MIPKSRFDEVNTKYQSLAAETEKLRAEAQEAATWRTKYEQDSARWNEERDLMRAHPAMVDDEAREAARFAWQRLPEKERPPLPDFVRSVAQDPAKAPKMLSPYFTSAPASGSSPVPPSVAPAVTPAPSVQQPPPTAGSGAPPARGFDFGALDDATKRGDWKRVEDLLAQYRGKSKSP